MNDNDTAADVSRVLNAGSELVHDGATLAELLEFVKSIESIARHAVTEEDKQPAVTTTNTAQQPRQIAWKWHIGIWIMCTLVYLVIRFMDIRL